MICIGRSITLRHAEPCVLALDGEREVEMKPHSATHVRLNPRGPIVVDARRAVAVASETGVFVEG